MAVSVSVSSSTKRQRTTSQDTPRKKLHASPSYNAHHESTIVSDIFELQVDELLATLEAEVDANIQRVSELLKQLKAAIEDIPPREPLLPGEAEASLKSSANIAIPFGSPPAKDAQYKLEYAKPAAINVIGSTASKTLLSRNGQITADLVVIMPARIFQEKDYRNHRYFHKKAYYTARIAAGLQTANIPGISYSFSLQNGNSLQPCLIVRKPTDGDVSITIRIICAGVDNCFTPTKLYPWVANLPSRSGSSLEEQEASTITPFYNSTLRSETLTLTYLTLIHKTSRDMPSFVKASLLFSVWLHQRGLGTELFRGGFGLFEAQALMAILLTNDDSKGQTALFRTRYNHHQLFKATLILLCNKNFVENPTLYNFSVESSEPHHSSQPLQQAKKSVVNGDSALFFDGVRAHNLFFKISPWAYTRLQRQAEITVKCLNGNDQYRFQHCFISKLDNIMTRYDQVIELTWEAPKKKSRIGVGQGEQEFGLSKTLHKTLKQAFTDRVSEIVFSDSIVQSWPIVAQRPRSSRTIQLHIVLDPIQASRPQDLGPSADDKDAAAAFRNFWGSKAELRRFRDGSIQETVVWSNNEESIVMQIIRYALNRHHGDDCPVSLRELGASLWEELKQPLHSKTLTVFETTLQSFRKLEQIIRDLKMPLAVRQISPAAAGLRYSSLNIDHKSSLEPLDVVIQFESSGQWPDNLDAIQQVKIAFLQKLSDLMAEHDGSIRSRVGLDQKSDNTFARPFLEIEMDSLCYHIIIYHDRELFLLRSSPVDRLEDRKLVLPEIRYHNMMFLRAPAHTSRIRDLCTKHSLLSQSIRLFKAWCSAHLLISHFREELLELLVVHIFTDAGSFGPPSSLRTAFLRVLSMLAKWDWHNEPLFVTLSDELDEGLRGQLNTHFEAWRKIDPTFSRTALIVGSTIDPTGTAWTEQGPSKMVAARLCALAKAATMMVRKVDLDLNPKQLFEHSTKEYDFVVHLNTKMVRSNSNKSSTIIDRYLEELRRVFGDTIVWFHSGDSPKIVAGLWNPLVESKRWKANLGYSTRPMDLTSTMDQSDDEAMDLTSDVSRNNEATLNEIVRLGGDLVSKATLKK